MSHDLVDAILGLTNLAAILYCGLGIYFRARRDSRLDTLEKAKEQNAANIAHIEGFLTAVSTYRPRP